MPSTKLTSEEIAAQIAEFKATGGLVDHIPQGKKSKPVKKDYSHVTYLKRAYLKRLDNEDNDDNVHDAQVTTLTKRQRYQDRSHKACGRYQQAAYNRYKSISSVRCKSRV